MRIHAPIAKRFRHGFTKLTKNEASAGILLIVVATLAMAVANSPASHYYAALFNSELAYSPIGRLHNLHEWINDALMPVFFCVVGLEIKREVIDGALSSPARRRLPVVAAAAGMAVPCAIYLSLTGTIGASARGWAIPAATDIAFALGVLGILGNRVPASLRLFLLTVAVVDDLGAVAIIALFYTAQIEPAWALGAVATVGALILANCRGERRAWVYAALGVVLWVCVLHSGVHATVAGVALAFCVPHERGNTHSLLLRMEHALAPWSNFLIVPLFGFANAGVALAGITPNALMAPVPLGIALGLFLGKQAGVLGAIAICDRTGFAARPHGTSWLQLWGMAVLCGIGFTMSLFIAGLAFPDLPVLVEEAKLGVLAGSVTAALLGYAILRLARTPAA